MLTQDCLYRKILILYLRAESLTSTCGVTSRKYNVFFSQTTQTGRNILTMGRQVEDAGTKMGKNGYICHARFCVYL